MLRYTLKRFIQMAVVLVIYATLVWFIFYAMPGDVTMKFLGNPRIKPAAIQKMRAQFGLDKPVHIQYFFFMKSLFTGNLGISFNHYPRTVWSIIAERWPRTVTLFLAGIVLYYAVGFYLGRVIAWRRGGVADYTATVGGIMLWTVFTPWWCLLLIWFFAFKLDWFPLGQFVTPKVWMLAPVDSNFVFTRMLVTGLLGPLAIFVGWWGLRRVIHDSRTRKWLNWGVAAGILGTSLLVWANSGLGKYALDILWHMGVPLIALLTIGFAGSMLLMRDSMLEVINEDYIMTARAKGLPERVIRDHHAARTALLPVVTSFVLAIAFALNGAVIIESVFSWPGIGRTLVYAVATQDYPLAVGAYTFLGLFALIAHFAADILYAVLDPRISYKRGEGA